ncbi:hypothetical protein [Paraburkholderia sp. SUR17]|uniref:hypothetical protein n=1 Tax=Paraburkholderia sp. SUR17 TaxID=3034358 RepID=UPI002408620A|nr:hypothetical protein [Paraburkholderia sp. SUR17]WEY38921.1 hypothetical protein P2869_00620 [Paraburkholderia sp. SUR17]
MNFIEPILALCSHRAVLAKENSVLPPPQSILSNHILSEQNLFGVSFDYFIDWTTNQLNRDFWLKCPVETADQSDWSNLSDESIASDLRNHQKFRDLVDFSLANSCSATAIIFDDRQQWSSKASTIICAHWPKYPDSKKGLDISRVGLPQIEEMIKLRSGGPVAIGRKGLIYGTSSLECHLSRTNALWPGDADLLVCEKSTMRPIALIEYKKHTASSTKKFQEQRLSNYYPYPDRRKYDRLALLSEQIASDRPIKIFILYYSTIESELSVKIEEIVGTPGSLIGGQVFDVDISPRDPVAGYRQVISKIVRQST